MNMGWIDASIRMPEQGVMVYVDGLYIAPRTGNPKACRRLLFGSMVWSSTEWRGMVGITHWWEETGGQA